MTGTSCLWTSAGPGLLTARKHLAGVVYRPNNSEIPKLILYWINRKLYELTNFYLDMLRRVLVTWGSPGGIVVGNSSLNIPLHPGHSSMSSGWRRQCKSEPHRVWLPQPLLPSCDTRMQPLDIATFMRHTYAAFGHCYLHATHVCSLWTFLP